MPSDSPQTANEGKRKQTNVRERKQFKHPVNRRPSQHSHNQKYDLRYTKSHQECVRRPNLSRKKAVDPSNTNQHGYEPGNNTILVVYNVWTTQHSRQDPRYHGQHHNITAVAFLLEEATITEHANRIIEQISIRTNRNNQDPTSIEEATNIKQAAFPDIGSMSRLIYGTFWIYSGPISFTESEGRPPMPRPGRMYDKCAYYSFLQVGVAPARTDILRTA